MYSQEEPFSKNLDSLNFIEGTFSTLISFQDTKGKWQKPTVSEFEFEKIMKSMFIEGGGLVPFDTTFSTKFRMTFDYYDLINIYRLDILDDSFGFMDIYCEIWDGEELVLTNENTGTQVINEGNRVYGKLIIAPFSEGGFRITALTSQDNIKTGKII